MTECQHKFFNELKKNVGRQKLPTGARESTAPRAILAPPGSVANCHAIQMRAVSPSYSLSSKTFSILGPFEGLFWDHYRERTYKEGDFPVDGTGG